MNKNLKLKQALIDLQKEYRNIVPNNQDNGLTISENYFNSLSAFEKKQLKQWPKCFF